MKNKESSASKIVLDSFESLFGDQEDMGKEDRVRMIPLSELSMPILILKQARP